MNTRRRLLTTTTTAAVLAALAAGSASRRATGADAGEAFEVRFTDAEWRARLTPQQYAVLRKEGTERPGSSPLDKEYRQGRYDCAGCALPLFSSATKFDSRTGWPSFWQPLDNAVATRKDRSLGRVRIEVHCRRCGGPPGHVFEDGPAPTGLRYCMNGLSLTFQPQAA